MKEKLGRFAHSKPQNETIAHTTIREMISTISWGASVSFILWFSQNPERDSPNHSPSPLTKFSSVKYSNLVTRHYSVVLLVQVQVGMRFAVLTQN